MTIREQIQEFEERYLSERAMLSKNTKGRRRPEKESELRTPFMRDRDRIVHSGAFRKLKRKTQVFLAPANDLFRTRLTHTLEVSQIARTISRALRLNDDLTEAIALGHDLGHTPFGHTGEKVLNEILEDGFKHNVQSLRVVDFLEKKGRGLNLTLEVRDGILKHSKTGKKHILPEAESDFPITLEGEVVRVSDIIAYVNHDIDDAIRSGLLKTSDLPKSCLKLLGDTHSKRINTMVKDVIETSRNSEHIRMSDEVLAETEKLRNFMFENVYTHPAIMKEAYKAERLLHALFEFLMEHPDVIKKFNPVNYPEGKKMEVIVADTIASMTDGEALRVFDEFFIPRPFVSFSR